MHRDPETAEPGNGISIYAFLYYIENYGLRRAIPRTRPALTRNVRDNLPRLGDHCAAAFFLRERQNVADVIVVVSRARNAGSLSFPPRRKCVTSRSSLDVSRGMVDSEILRRLSSDFGERMLSHVDGEGIEEKKGTTLAWNCK